MTTVHCPSLSAFLHRLPAGSLVGTSINTLMTPEQFLAARPAFVAAWALRIVSSPCGNYKGFAFCAGLAFGTYVVALPEPNEF